MIEFAGFRQQPGGGFAFTMVPNQFLDEIVPFEKPCVVKVISLILRRTLGWIDQNGQRRQQEQVAYSEFAREMNMSVQAVADGLRIAMEKGYIVRVKPGAIRGSHGTPEGAWYSLRWLESPKTAREEQAVLMESPEKLPAADSKKQSEDDSEKQNRNDKNVALKNRVMRNKPDSEKKHVEIKSSSTCFRTTTDQAFGTYSVYIGNVITEISEQFEDTPHRLPNIKQALNLWQKAQLSEADFVKLLYRARDITRANAFRSNGKTLHNQETISPGKAQHSWITLAGEAYPDIDPKVSARNRMPYFFKVLRELLEKSGKDSPERNHAEVVVEAESQILISDLNEILVSSDSTILTEHEKFALASTVACNTVTHSENTEPEGVTTSTTTAVVSVAPQTSEQGNELAGSNGDSDYNQANTGWRRKLVEEFSQDVVSTVNLWEKLLIRIEDNGLKALAARTAGIEASLACTQLRAAAGLHQDRLTGQLLDIIVIYRNAFDARYGQRHLATLAALLEEVTGKPVKLHPVHF